MFTSLKTQGQLDGATEPKFLLRLISRPVSRQPTAPGSLRMGYVHENRKNYLRLIIYVFFFQKVIVWKIA